MRRLTRKVDTAFLDRQINTNLKGTIYVTSAVIAAMRTQDPLQPHLASTRRASTPLRPIRGSIITLGSTAAITAGRGQLPYQTAKHGVIGATKSAAADYASDGIRVNCVCPGLIDTPMARHMMTLTGIGEDGLEAIVPLGGGLGDVRDVAGPVLWLAGESSRFVTGAVIVVDGGFTLAAARL